MPNKSSHLNSKRWLLSVEEEEDVVEDVVVVVTEVEEEDEVSFSLLSLCRDFELELTLSFFLWHTFTGGGGGGYGGGGYGGGGYGGGGGGGGRW